MVRRENVEKILSKAKELEMNYDWVDAAALYKQALDAVGKTDFLMKGEIHERIGYSFFRSATQAHSVEEFKKRMQMSVESYEKAAELFEKVAPSKGLYSRAMAKYSSFWLIEDPSWKKELLDDCWRLMKEALESFEAFGDHLGYGKTFRSLSLCLFDEQGLGEDWREWKRTAEDAIRYSQNVVAKLSKAEGSDELAWAYAMTPFVAAYWGVQIFEERKGEVVSMISNYLKKALELSEKIEDAYFKGFLYSSLSWSSLVVTSDLQAALRYAEKALQQSERSNDNFVLTHAYFVLNYVTYVSALTEEDPDIQRERYKKAIRYAEESIRHCLLLCRYDWVSWSYGFRLVESYFGLAELETSLKEKRALLKRAVEVGRKGSDYAQLSGSPPIMQRMFHVLSQAIYSLSKVETSIDETRKLLEEALELSEKDTKLSDRISPPFASSHGVEQNILAQIKADLAEMEEDEEKKRHLLEEAVLGMEKSIEKSKSYVETVVVRALPRDFALLGWSYDRLGKILDQLYSLTKDEKIISRAVEVHQGTAQAYQKAGMHSRVAEAYWKAAKLYNRCCDYLKAAESFEHASKSYMLAAEKMPQLKDFYSEYRYYMEAWAELEKSRYEHEMENYAQASKCYRMCSRRLEMIKRWSYLSSYFLGWSLLERGEKLSRLDRPQDAMKAFDEAGRIFGGSANGLHKKVRELESSEERDEASKLATIAILRRQYCIGRVLMEEARLSNRKGDKISSAEKYSEAARIFEGIMPNLERKEARVELQFAATLCRAWEKMALAEERGDPVLYGKAAKLFSKAGEINRRKTAGLVAIGNGCFCEALELGMRFMVTSNMDFYSGAKLQMENAASCYRRAGFEKLALWVEATKRLFDAYVYAGKAETETEPEKRVRFYLMAEKCLELSAKLYGEAGYLDKKNEAVENLERIRKERELALSLSEVLTVSPILSSTTGVSMPDSTEKAAGLNNFESVNVRARLSVPDNFVLGEEFQVKLDLVNVGKKAGLLVRVEGLVPRKCEVLRVSSNCVLEDDSLNMRGRRLNPLSVESVSVWVQVVGMVGVSLSPSVVYVDEFGDFRTIRVEGAKIFPVVEFGSKVAQVVFNYLVDAFVEDSEKRRLSLKKSGWRSLPQIIKGAGVSKRSLYGPSGRLGPGLSELKRNGLVDLRAFRGERGRGGHVLRVRVHYEKELVRRYVKKKAPDLSL